MQEMTLTTPNDLEIAMSRTFDAPRRLVYKALMNPELVKRWMGGDPWPLVICEIDPVVGGALRYVWRSADGQEMGMSGTFLELVPDEKVVHTEVFDVPWFKGEAIAISELKEHDGQTTFTLTLRYESKEVRDGVLASPMQYGVAKTFDRLAVLLAEGLV